MKYDEKIISHLKSQRVTKERVLGRYNSSEIYQISRGFVTPAEWVTGRPADDDGVWRMFLGTMTDAISKAAMESEGYDCNFKKIAKVNDEISIVCLPDAVKVEDKILHEFKTLTFGMDGQPKLVKDVRNPHPSHRMQVECYLRGFDLEEAYISYLQLIPRDSISFIYRRSDVLWGKIQNDLKNFHEDVKAYIKTNNITLK